LVDFGSLGAIAGVLGLIIAAGTLLGTSLRVGRQTATVSNYREAAQSWESKARAQESEISDLQAKVLALENSKAAQDAEIRVLRDMVTGRSALAELQQTIQQTVDGLRSELITKPEFSSWQTEVRGRLDRMSAHES
jgi:hypothetical protein